MSEKIRIGNTYYHTEHEQNVVVTHRDGVNNVWYRGVVSSDNAGVIATSDWIEQQPYDEFLGQTRTRDYPDDWEEMAQVVKQRDGCCQGCGRRADASHTDAPDWQDEDAELHAHHIVPLGCGGTNTMRNLITLCDGCHGRIHGGSI